MTIKKVFCTAVIALFATASMAANFQIKRGDLPDGSKIDVELRTRSGDCSTFPTDQMHCLETYSKLKGISAENIDRYNAIKKFELETTVLLNIDINSQPVASCQMLQTRLVPNATIVINKEGCVIQ
ncbi:hypothetical protein BN59_01681 [Legionella massiliensis]|uniref:Uncharacterized protein n=1 Tax=Legionella massiliensis TaxID=1034943 RepID=A0A078L022_9GAMM|nr:hypothetical protein [Legionella massiliensis]CDZ77398.1 hypothetical protein BN59_01681 [Legionella massiliensis]CEE13136.1 hypothetical protein BN1094_01681 [Legionella massiliensis]